MEVLTAIRFHVVAAKNSLIKAGIEMAKLPVPMEHGLKLMRTVHELDKLAEWLTSAPAQSSEAAAVRGKGRKRSRLQKKESQSHVEPADVPNSGDRPGETRNATGLSHLRSHLAG